MLGPWHFDRTLVVLTPLQGNGDLTVECSNKVVFCVQIYNVPLLYVSKEIVELLHSIQGTMDKVDMRSSGDCMRKYIKVCVTFDISYLLKLGLRVKFHSLDPKCVFGTI